MNSVTRAIDIDRLMTAVEIGQVSRRIFLGSLAALAGCGPDGGTSTPARSTSAPAPPTPVQTVPPIPVRAINHMTLSVSDPALTLAWYQGLFGMPVAARQAETVVLRVGDGPQFLALGGGASDTPRITHLCLAVDNFDNRPARADSRRERRRGVGSLRPDAVARQDARGRVRRGACGHTRALRRRPGRGGRPASGLELLRGGRAAGRALFGDTGAGAERRAPRGARLQPLHDLRHGPAAIHPILSGAVRYAGRHLPGRVAGAQGRVGQPFPGPGRRRWWSPRGDHPTTPV